MTFERFESVVRTRYPEAEVYAHGKMAGRNAQNVAIAFASGGKCYQYSGAYEDVLRKMGFSVISRKRASEYRARLSRMVEENGKEDEFFGGMIDWTKEIAEVSKILEESIEV